VPEAAALLARLDAILREVLELRAELAASLPVEPGDNITTLADDLADGNLLDTHAAQERFGYQRDTIAKWCRTDGIGVKIGGRWMASIPRLQRRLNGR
jgi:hypothetical protein